MIMTMRPKRRSATRNCALQCCLWTLLCVQTIRNGHGFAVPRSTRAKSWNSAATTHLVEADDPATRRQLHRQLRPHSSTSLAMSMFSQNDELVGTDRIRACIPYLLPLIDGDQFGRFMYYRLPPLGWLNDITIGPLAQISHHIPFLSVILFCLLTLGTRFNTDMPRSVRFNAQQAALLDVALIFPELIGSCFAEEPLPRSIVEPCNNFTWYVYMSVVVYSVATNLRGKKPDQIPFLSGSAEFMVGPF